MAINIATIGGGIAGLCLARGYPNIPISPSPSTSDIEIPGHRWRTRVYVTSQTLKSNETNENQEQEHVNSMLSPRQRNARTGTHRPRLAR